MSSTHTAICSNSVSRNERTNIVYAYRAKVSWGAVKGVSVPTLQRLEAGDPAVGVGIVATALWLIKRDGELGKLAAPEHDQGAIEMNVREAVELGRARARASAEGRRKRQGS